TQAEAVRLPAEWCPHTPAPWRVVFDSMRLRFPLRRAGPGAILVGKIPHVCAHFGRLLPVHVVYPEADLQNGKEAESRLFIVLPDCGSAFLANRDLSNGCGQEPAVFSQSGAGFRSAGHEFQTSSRFRASDAGRLRASGFLSDFRRSPAGGRTAGNLEDGLHLRRQPVPGGHVAAGGSTTEEE